MASENTPDRSSERAASQEAERMGSHRGAPSVGSPLPMSTQSGSRTPSEHSDQRSHETRRAPNYPAVAATDDRSNASVMTYQPTTSEQNAPHAGRRESIHETMQRSGLGVHTQLVALDTRLAQAIVLFWSDFGESDVPIKRRTELVKEAVASAYWARTARQQPIGNPNDDIYVQAVMRRISLNVTIYMDERRNRGAIQNSHDETEILQAPAMPNDYLIRLREIASNPMYQSPVPEGITLLPMTTAMRGTRGGLPENSSLLSTDSSTGIPSRILREMHDVGQTYGSELEAIAPITRDQEQMSINNSDNRSGEPAAHQRKENTNATFGLAIDLKDRIILQRIHDSEMAKEGITNYPDQGIRWTTHGHIIDTTKQVESMNTRGNQGVESAHVQPLTKTRVKTPMERPPASVRLVAKQERTDEEQGWYANEQAPSRAHEDERQAVNQPFRPRVARTFRVHSNPPESQAHNYATPGIIEVQDRYRHDMHERLRAIINDHCSVKMTLAIGDKDRPKAPDIKTVTLYKGEDRMRDLEAWVLDVSIYFAIANLGGPDPERERYRVLYCGMLVDGKAKQFMRHHVYGLNRAKIHWTFSDIATALYDRFILASITQDARVLFEQVRYTTDTGIQGLYDKICDIAETMMDQPDRYTMADRFVRALPVDWREEIFKRRFSTEINSIEEFVSEAKAIETAHRMTQHYATAHVSRAPPNAHKSSQRDTEGCPRTLERDRIAPRREKKRNTDRPTRTPLRDNPRDEPHTDEAARIKPSANTRADTGKRTTRPLSEVKCYDCGEFGHYKPDCPHKVTRGEPRRKEYVRAAHTAARSGSEAGYDGETDEEGSRCSLSPGSSRTGHSEAADSSAESEAHTEVPYETDFDSEFYARSSDTEFIFAMRDTPATCEQLNAMSDTVDDVEDAQTHIVKRRAGTFKSAGPARPRPVVLQDDKACLLTYTEVSGHKAWTLWDAGSTMSSITPSFVDVAGIMAFPLLDPFIIQLGTVGSRAKITHGALLKIHMAGCDVEMYADICNLDRYDMIMGTPFMHAHNVVLDFAAMTVIVNGVPIPAVPYPGDVDPRLHRGRASDRRAT